MEEIKKPDKWPKDIPLPSIEEIQKEVREGEKMIEDIFKKLELKRTSPEMFNTQITI